MGYWDPPDDDPPDQPHCPKCGAFMKFDPDKDWAELEWVTEDVDLDKAKRLGYEIIAEYPEYNLAVCNVPWNVHHQLRRCSRCGNEVHKTEI